MRKSAWPRSKVCTSCGLEKTADRFHLNGRKEGPQAACRDCKRVYDRETKRKRYATDPEYRAKILARNAASAQKHRVRGLATMERYRKRLRMASRGVAKRGTKPLALQPVVV